jgi:hypothetical protein
MSTTPPPGSPTSPIPPAPTPFPPPRMHEEKEEEKRHEKDEKSQEEKWRRDPLSAIVWACILIWAGVVLLLSNLNLLPRIPGLPLPMNDWSLIFLGAGIIILLEVLVRLVMPEHRRGVVGSLIVAIIFIGIGGGGSVGWGFLWGFGLIAIGVVVLLGGFRGRR